MNTLESNIAIKDLVDFYKRWPDLRKDALIIQSQTRLSSERKALLEWMITVIDRVGPADFGPVMEKK